MYLRNSLEQISMERSYWKLTSILGLKDQKEESIEEVSKLDNQITILKEVMVGLGLEQEIGSSIAAGQIKANECFKKGAI
jgi:hypothetical protein